MNVYIKVKRCGDVDVERVNELKMRRMGYDSMKNKSYYYFIYLS
jgi:hypothetical protein